jgi:hypothetical protein
MVIPPRYTSRCIYHFTHLYNLPVILEHGLLAVTEQERLGIAHKTIAYTGIQERRSGMRVPCGSGGVVHDYVPLYFCQRSSMLLAIVYNKIADQQYIIYFQFPIEIINQYPSVFTDAAANTMRIPNFYDNPSDLEKLNWEAIDNLKWSMPNEELKQARMAEVLIHRRIDVSSASRIIVWNESFRDAVKEEYEKAEIQAPPIDFQPKHYFVTFWAEELFSPVTGPIFIRRDYEDTVNTVLEQIGKAPAPSFKNLFQLRDALSADMSCIPETAEIVGLESDNEMHSEDVGTHTLKVVDTLRKLTEFEVMNDTDQLLVELAAFLHDIGKGPKSRWVDKGGRQQVDPDHPIKALPMVKRILTEEVGSMKKRSAKVICKLVCYHDLVGDIVSKGRRLEELVDIAEDERELDMLIALAKADMRSANPLWIKDQEISELRSKVVETF